MRPSGEIAYVDALLADSAREHPEFARAFERDFHWGYWSDGRAADPVEEYAGAAARMTAEVCRALDVQPGQRILDAGCGIGGALRSLNDSLRGAHLVGLNIDERQLRNAALGACSGGPSAGNRLELVAGDACSLPFPNAFFDRVLALECIFHFPDRRQFFQEVRRVLKPGGILALTDFVPSDRLAPWIRLGWRSPIQRHIRRMSGSVDIRSTLRDYRDLAAEVNFECIRQEDISVNVLPSCPVLRQLVRRVGERVSNSRVHRLSIQTAMRVSEWSLRSGFVRYMILAFRDTRELTPDCL